METCVSHGAKKSFHVSFSLRQGHAVSFAKILSTMDIYYLIFIFTFASLCEIEHAGVSRNIFFQNGAPHVKIDNGLLVGTTKFSRNGRPYSAFLGIPYGTIAERFQPSEPIIGTGWEGVLDATKPGNICPQKIPHVNKSLGNEDCLNLNVYAPMDTVPLNNTKHLPVMVCIIDE